MKKYFNRGILKKKMTPVRKDVGLTVGATGRKYFVIMACL